MVKQVLTRALFLVLMLLCLACSENGSDDLTGPELKAKVVQKAPFSPALADWPHSISNITPDPRVKFGRLNNGLRYAILPVPDENGTVSIQMHISAGFKDEPENLYGIAHILEHMAFRVAHKNSDKSMIHDMQSLGAGFGFDLNGFTSNDNTLYRVNLDSAKSDKISSALQSFSQLVMEPRLTAEYLDIERKVVLSELRQRDSIETRARLQRQQFKYPDRKRNKVAGIGTEESLAAITLEDVEGFFNSHYTPNNTVLIIAGGVHLAKTENKIAQLFSNWKKGINPPLNYNRQTKIVDLSSFPKVKNYYEPGAKTQLNLIVNTPSTLQNDTLENQREYFAERIANAMIKRRLKPRIEVQNNVNWINLYKAREQDYDSQSVTIGAKDYVIASTFFEEERLRAIKYGFTEEELALALKSEEAFYKRQNENPNHINAWAEASRLRNSFNSGKVYLNPAQKLTNFQSFSKTLSLQDYHDAAKSLWTNFNPRYWFQSSKTTDATIEKVEKNLQGLLQNDISEPLGFEPDVFKKLILVLDA